MSTVTSSSSIWSHHFTHDSWLSYIAVHSCKLTIVYFSRDAPMLLKICNPFIPHFSNLFTLSICSTTNAIRLLCCTRLVAHCPDAIGMKHRHSRFQHFSPQWDLYNSCAPKFVSTLEWRINNFVFDNHKFIISNPTKASLRHIGNWRTRWEDFFDRLDGGPYSGVQNSFQRTDSSVSVMLSKGVELDLCSLFHLCKSVYALTCGQK